MWLFQLKASVRTALQSLPTPRNDYEIVVPDESDEPMESSRTTDNVEDQADADARMLKEQEEKRVFRIFCPWSKLKYKHKFYWQIQLLSSL